MMDKKDVLIIYNSVEYFIDLIKDKGVAIDSLYKENPSKVSRGLHKVSEKIKFGESFWYSQWKNEIKNKKVIIIFAPVKIEVFRYIKKINPNIRIIYWFWNPAYRMGKPTKEYYDLADIWSFSEGDCERYNFKYNTTFYFDNSPLISKPKKYDTIFVGRDKKRKTELLSIEENLKNKGLMTYFYIVPHYGEPDFDKIKPISYDKYRDIVSESVSIIDMIPLGQEGLTLRPMESIFLKKKLITTNEDIVTEDFYNPNNIFILGKDDPSNLSDFLTSDYEDIDPEIVNKYDFLQWLSRFGIKV